MLVINLIKHNFQRQWRDRLGLALTLFTAPTLVLLYGLLFSHDQIAPEQIVVYGCDETVFSDNSFTKKVQETFLRNESSPVFTKTVDHLSALKRSVSAGNAFIGVECISKESDSSSGEENTLSIVLHGNINHPYFQAGSASIQLMIYKTFVDSSGLPVPMEIEERLIKESSPLTSFDRYVPALLVFATIMLVFSAAMSITREVENGTLERLKLTRLSVSDLMIGLSVVQLTLGIFAVGLTFFTAWMLGFHTEGSMLVAFLLTVICCFACVGLGMTVASLSRTLILSFLIASVSMFLMVLFSGIVLPRPEVNLFNLVGQPIDLFDILPTTHLGIGLEKILIFGAGFREIAYEMVALLVLSMVYFGVGVAVFRKTSYSFFIR